MLQSLLFQNRNVPHVKTSVRYQGATSKDCVFEMKPFEIIADSWTFRSHFIMEDVKECQLQLSRVGSLLWYFSHRQQYKT